MQIIHRIGLTCARLIRIACKLSASNSCYSRTQCNVPNRGIAGLVVWLIRSHNFYLSIPKLCMRRKQVSIWSNLDFLASFVSIYSMKYKPCPGIYLLYRCNSWAGVVAAQTARGSSYAWKTLYQTELWSHHARIPIWRCISTSESLHWHWSL